MLKEPVARKHLIAHPSAVSAILLPFPSMNPIVRIPPADCDDSRLCLVVWADQLTHYQYLSNHATLVSQFSSRCPLVLLFVLCMIYLHPHQRLLSMRDTLPP